MPQSATAVSGRKRKLLDDSDNDDGEALLGSKAASGDYPQVPNSAVKKHEKNRNGLTTLLNGVVSMKELCKSVGLKDHDHDALPLFDLSSLGQGSAAEAVLCTVWPNRQSF